MKQYLSSKEIAELVGSKDRCFAIKMAKRNPLFPLAIPTAKPTQLKRWKSSEILKWIPTYKLDTARQIGGGHKGRLEPMPSALVALRNQPLYEVLKHFKTRGNGLNYFMSQLTPSIYDHLIERSSHHYIGEQY